MTEVEVLIGLASENDLDGIVALQAANQPENGGTLSANLGYSRISEMMHEMPLIVARRDHRVTGYLMTSSRSRNSDVPVISAMLSVYPGSVDAYVYGPICVSSVERGKGVAQAMFLELRRLAPAREGILFIRQDNEASLRAHVKMGMSEVAGFKLGGIKFVVLSYFG